MLLTVVLFTNCRFWSGFVKILDNDSLSEGF